jgi:hypothetical protein
MYVGITQRNKCPDWVLDMIDGGIDLLWESAVAEVTAEMQAKYPDADESEIDEMAERELEYFETDSQHILIGDWKQIDGQYVPDTDGKHGFAAEYTDFCGGTLSIVWSRTTKQCHHTSPCFVMSDGSGPCGDLDTSGNSRTAYCLPE